MMRRWRYQTDARRRMSDSGNLRIDLVTRKLSAFAGLRALRYLDLQLFSIDQIVAGDAKPSGSNLLDSTVARVSVVIRKVARWILAAFPSIAFTPNAIHRNGQGFVRFFAYGPVGHRACFEAFDDIRHWFDLFDGYRLMRRLKLHQPTQRAQTARLVVYQL